MSAGKTDMDANTALFVARGLRGRVTDALDRWIADSGQQVTPEFFACGPDGMLRAVSDRARQHGWTAWLSLDKHMGCGMGACLGCTIEVRTPAGVEYRQVCSDGPVFDLRQIVWR